MGILDIVAGLLTALFGWLGGRGEDYWKKHQKFPKWIFESWVRDYMIPLVCVGLLMIYGIISWWLALFFILTLGALSTYWDEFFGYDNYYFHGLMIGIASFPIAIVTGHWWLWIIRSVIICLWMGIWSAIFKNVHVEESGRYFVVGASTFLLV